MTDENKMNLDDLIQADADARAKRVPKDFTVIRYGIKAHNNAGTPSHTTGLYGTFEDAVMAAKHDNKTFKPKYKSVACIVDNTERVVYWAENIAHAAKTLDVAQTQKAILELIQFVQRGY